MDCMPVDQDWGALAPRLCLHTDTLHVKCTAGVQPMFKDQVHGKALLLATWEISFLRFPVESEAWFPRPIANASSRRRGVV